jgi:hypothetical protein
MNKNTASQKWTVFAFNRSTGEPVTGDAAYISANLRIDDGDAVAVTDTNPSEQEDGYYVFDLSQSETNGNKISIFPVSSTSGVQVIGCPAVIFTTPASFQSQVAQSGDAYGIVNNGTYGNSALETLVDDIETSLANGTYGLNALLTAINTRLATSGYTAPPSVVDIQSGLAKTTDITALNDFNPASDVVAHVTLVDTTTTNTDMRGTNSALLAANYTAPNNSGITGIKTKTDQLVFTVANKVDATATLSGGGDATEAHQLDMIDKISGLMSKDHTLSSAVGTFDPTTDSTEAIRNRGDAAWLSPSGVGGTIAITFNIKDDSGVNILDAWVEVWDTAGTSLKERKQTNSGGNAAFNCNAEDYIIRITKSGYSIADQNLTISIPATINYVMTAFVIPAPTDPAICRLFTLLANPDGSIPAVSEVTAIMEITDVPDGVTKYYSFKTVPGVYAAGTGLLYFDIVRLCSGKINVPGFLGGTITAPDLSTQNIGSIITA